MRERVLIVFALSLVLSCGQDTFKEGGKTYGYFQRIGGACLMDEIGDADLAKELRDGTIRQISQKEFNDCVARRRTINELERQTEELERQTEEMRRQRELLEERR